MTPFTSAKAWGHDRNLSAADFEASLYLKGWLADWASWVNFITRNPYFVGLRHDAATEFSAPMKQAFDARHAMTASAKAMRRGLKTKVFGDLLATPRGKHRKAP